MKIIATECTARDLKPGELFSTAGQFYWATFKTKRSIGERVYIRTEEPAENAMDADTTVYRITIEKEHP